MNTYRIAIYAEGFETAAMHEIVREVRAEAESAVRAIGMQVEQANLAKREIRMAGQWFAFGRVAAVAVTDTGLARAFRNTKNGGWEPTSLFGIRFEF